MSAPSFLAATVFCPSTVNKLSKETGGRLFLGLVVADTVVSLTSLIVGILGAVSVIAMPPAAAYALIGVSSLITLAWLGLAIFGIVKAVQNCQQNRRGRVMYYNS